MEQWKSHIQAGNLDFIARRYSDAERHYSDALQRAMRLFPEWFDRSEAVAAIIISYCNLTAVYEALKRHTQCLHCSCDCYDFLNHHAMQNTQHNIVDSALLAGLRYSYTQLLLRKKTTAVQTPDSRSLPPYPPLNHHQLSMLTWSK